LKENKRTRRKPLENIVKVKSMQSELECLELFLTTSNLIIITDVVLFPEGVVST
jgi:hypothetical protein